MAQAQSSQRETGSSWLERSLMTDRATGLPARAMFDDVLGRVTAAAETSVAVLILHVSGAATIRSRYGAVEADQLLRRAGDVVRGAIRGWDLAARFDDDDLGVIMPGSDLADALRVARRIAHDTERRNSRTGPGEPPVFFAFGAAAGRGCSPAELYEAADPRRANIAPETSPATVGYADADDDDGPSVA